MLVVRVSERDPRASMAKLRNACLCAALAHASPVVSPAACEPFKEFYSQIWDDFGPLASHGPITVSNVTALLDLVKTRMAWDHYFLEVAVVGGEVFYRAGDRTRLGVWAVGSLKLIAHTVKAHKEWIPDVYFILACFDEAVLERRSHPPLPLFAGLTTKDHYDIPAPGWEFFAEAHGISSSGVSNDLKTWGTAAFQQSLGERFPWEERGARAFFRGHDWDSSNQFIELLSHRDREECVGEFDQTGSFGYRSWYEKLSSDAAHAEFLDVGLTGAPRYKAERDGGRNYAQPVSLPDHARHKYLLHLDGSTFSSRLIKLFTLGSVVLKQDSPYEEYFYRRLEPFVDFVPFQRNRCNTDNLTATIRWLRDHDKVARTIAKRGQDLSRGLLSIDGAACYWQRLLAVYGSLQAFDPRSVTRLSEMRRWPMG